MSDALPKTEVLTGVPLEFAPVGLRTNRVTTVALTGGGTYNLRVTHLDNDPITVLSGVTTVTDPLYTLYGVGYTKVEIEHVSGSVFASAASSRG